MGIGSGTAALIGGLVGAGGSIASGAMGASAAGSAASDQSQAAEQAAQLQYQASQNALGFQEQEYNQNQANLQPWLQSGSGALSNLDYLLGIGSPNGNAFGGSGANNGFGGAGINRPVAGVPTNPSAMSLPTNPSGSPALENPNMGAIRSGWGTLNSGQQPSGTPVPYHGPNAMASTLPQSGALPTAGTISPMSPSMGVNPSLGGFGSLMQPYSGTFTAPTAAQMEANDPGYQARMQLGQDAMERSAAARGGVLTGGTAQAENQAAQDYASNEYNNYYNQAFNTYAQGYNQYEQGQTNQYNRLASLAGIGQQSASQLGYLGNQSAQGISNNLLSTAQNMGQAYQNAGAANASGIVGAANAYGGAISGAGSSLSNLLMLQQLGGLGGSGTGLSTSYGDEGGY